MDVKNDMNLIKLFRNELKRMKYILNHRIYINPKTEREIIESFHKLYYYAADFGKTWNNTLWLGVNTWKCPLDLWIYQEIIFDVKPDFIIESGTAYGGSALFLASLCDLVNHGQVISIDIEKKNVPKHKRITYLIGSSISENNVNKIKYITKDAKKILVILDSDHSKHHVLKELNIYSRLVTKDSYIIVEDTNINGNPVRPEFGEGPFEAVNEFMNKNKNFTIDKSKEKFFLTFNSSGYLKRIR